MVIRIEMLDDAMPPLIGIAGAGARGVNFAGHYLEKELLPEDSLCGCSLVTLNDAEAAHPAVLLVIAFAGDVGVRQELEAWARGCQPAPSQLVLFCVAGDVGDIRLPGPCVCIADTASAEAQLTAALNCVAQALVCQNLVNLRVCELREVCGEARQLHFATGLGSGKERAREALDRVFATPGTRARIQSAHGIWAQIAAPGGPALWEVDCVGRCLRGCVLDDTIVHLGGMNLRADGNVARVSVLVSTG